MKFIIGRKLQMTQLFDDDGVVQPVTVISLEPLNVSLLRSEEKDGYSAVQVSYPQSKKQAGHREFRGDTSDYEMNQAISGTDVFGPGDVVRVSAQAKGKGFQGVVRRHGFHGGPRSHGQKHNERQPGSIGSGLRSRVPKGTRMAGRTGGQQVTIKGTRVISVDKERGLLLLHGSIPGRRGTLVTVQGV
ncbi:MAG: 50S ribosomal protein L3 [Candidatus Kaiserbacteria bacterium]|nr:50S ribosomal protein L3 [Candidatus Kaiserbacteria bacterium]